MLSDLHALINKAVPIVGMCDNGDGTYRVDYASEPTAEQIAVVNQIITEWPSTLSKHNQLRELDLWFSEQQKAGFVTTGGWKLGLDVQDVTLLTGAFVLAKEAAAMNLPLPQIIDTDGVPHALSLQEMTELMLAYGAHRAQLSAEYAAQKAAIVG